MEKEMIRKKKDLTQSYSNMETCGILVMGCLEAILSLSGSHTPVDLYPRCIALAFA